MPKVTNEYSVAQREAILTAGVRCFAKFGFHRSTMRDLIRESGMSAGALYSYFKSKEELIEAIALSRHRRENEWITSALSHGSVSDGLHALLRSFAKALTDPKAEQDRRLNVQVWSEALLDPKIKTSVLAGIESPTKLLTAYFRAAQRTGVLTKEVNCRALSRVLIALYQGLLLQISWEPGMSLSPHIAIIDAMLLGFVSGRPNDV